MPDAAYLLEHLRVARGRLLQRYGVTRHSLAADVKAGRVRRLRNGVFAANSLSPDIAIAATHGGALTCQAALRQHGIWTLEATPRVHVWMGTNGRIHPHASCACTAHFFHGPTQLGTADVATALLHTYLCAGEEAFFVSFESAWNARLLSRAVRAQIRTALPAHSRWLVDIARGDAESGLESLIRIRLHLIGILADCQVEIRGVGRVDFVIDGRLIIEADGRDNHASAEHRHRDLMRDAAASRLGYETLRFDYAQIVHDWPTVQRAIVAALGRAKSRA